MTWKLLQPNPLQLLKMKRGITEDVLAKILVNRDMPAETAEQIMTQPDNLLEDPAGIYGINEAAEQIADCLRDETSSIYIFADYDVDGITSGFVIGKFLSAYKKTESIHVFWPDRADGYGLNMDYCQEIVKEKTGRTLVITVDNGISKKEEAAYLKANGIEVVITDHHQPQQDLLPDCVICDPHMSEDSAGHHLCGCGVAWKVCQMIEDIMVRKYNYDSGRPFLQSMLYAVAIGTIADVMPLTPENIAIIRLGMTQLNNRRGPKNFSYLKRMIAKNKWTPNDIAWEIAPRMNACGRMGNIGTAVEFMLGEDNEESELNTLYLNVEEINEQRKKVSKNAEKAADKENYDDTEICLFDASKYPRGILGIIAGKIADKQKKPAFVYAIDENGKAKGSARSNTIELINLLQKEKEKGTLLEFGGHNFACAFGLMQDKLQEFLNDMNESIKAYEMPTTNEEPELLLDCSLNLSDVRYVLFDTINALPYDSNSFRKPVFLFKGLIVDTYKLSGNNPDNIQFTFNDGNQEMKVWGWQMGNKYEELGQPQIIDLAATMDIDFTNKKRITLKIIDLRPAC